MQDYDVVVLGSINMDIMVTVDRYPQYGETVFARTIVMTPGGKGSNQATGVAKQGMRLKFLGSVGDDPAGKQLRADLHAQGVDTQSVLIDPTHGTGTFVPIVDDYGENTMVGTLGANATITAEYVDDAFAGITASALLLQMETSRESILPAMKTAHARGMYVVLDPAPAEGYFQEALAYADLVTPNQQETERITGIRVINQETAIDAARAFHALGVKNSVIKMGVQGNVLFEDGKVSFIPAHKVKVVNTVGAGDVFAAALVSRYVKTHDLLDAVEYGNAAAAVKISRVGGLPSIPTAHEVKKFLTESPRLESLTV